MKQPMLGLVFCCMVPGGVVASPVPDFPFITVTGSAQLEVEPDTAQLRLVIRATESTAEQATTAVYRQGNALLDFLKSKDVELDAIEAAQINKEATYQDYSSRTITGYSATQPVTVQLKSIEHFVDIMDYLFKQPNIFSIQSQFGSSKQADYETELMAKAGADARKRAEQLSAAQGVALHSVFAISEGSRNWGSLAGDFGFGGGAVYGPQMRASADGMESSSLVMPKSIQLQQSVNVIYRLEIE